MDESSSAAKEKQMPLQISEEEQATMRKKAHECPVPKPPGIIGRVLGFKGQDSGEKQPRPLVVTQKAPKMREDDT